MLKGAYGRESGVLEQIGILTGEYLGPTFGQLGNITPAVTAALYFLPFQVPRDVLFDQLAFNLQTAQAGAEARLGLYDNDPTTGFPDNLLIDAGILDLSVTTGLRTIAMSARHLPSITWAAVHLKNVVTQVTMTGQNGPLNVGAHSIPSGFITAGSNNRGTTVATAYGVALPAKAQSLSLIRSSSQIFPTFVVRKAA